MDRIKYYLFPVHEIEQALFYPEDIAGSEPAVGREGCLVGLWVVVVAFCYHGALDERLARLSRRHVVVIVVHET